MSYKSDPFGCPVGDEIRARFAAYRARPPEEPEVGDVVDVLSIGFGVTIGLGLGTEGLDHDLSGAVDVSDQDWEDDPVFSVFAYVDPMSDDDDFSKPGDQ